MDDQSRRRRQNDSYADSTGRGYAMDRYRSALNSSSRGGAGFPASAYYEASAPYSGLSAAMQYPSQPSYAYNSDMMYGVSQTGPSHVAAGMYDSSSQFGSRSSAAAVAAAAALPMLSDVTTPYFQNDTSTPAQAQALQQQQQHAASSSSPIVYQQHQSHSPVDTRAGTLLQPGYQDSPTMGISGASGDMMPDEYASTSRAQVPGIEDAYNSYQTALKEIFSNIIAGRLMEASRSLVEISEWLLGHVADLGLTVDEVSLQSDRIRLWGEFNTAWLALFQRQTDLLTPGPGQVQPPQSLMSQSAIHQMADDLIRMCDVIEKHGLVDYQYGVAEEQIMLSITECLDLQESIEGRDEMSQSPRGRA